MHVMKEEKFLEQAYVNNFNFHVLILAKEKLLFFHIITDKAMAILLNFLNVSNFLLILL